MKKKIRITLLLVWLTNFLYISHRSTNQRQQIIKSKKTQSYFQDYIYSRNTDSQEIKMYLKDQSSKSKPKSFSSEVIKMHLQRKHLPAISFWRVLLSPLTAAACTSDANKEPLKRQFAEILILFQGIIISQICTTNIFCRNSVLEKKQNKTIKHNEFYKESLRWLKTALKRINSSVKNKKEQTHFLFCGLNLPLSKIQPEKAYIKEIYTYVYCSFIAFNINFSQ